MISSANVYELLIQSVADYAIYMLDPDGYVLSWNAGAERIKGYSASEIIGQHFSRFYRPEEVAAGAPERALAEAASKGRFAAEGWSVRRDGSHFWAQIVMDPIYQSGELVAFAKITRDITEQRKAYQAALESERRFRLLVEGVTDYAIYMLDTQGFVTNWNAGAQRIKGYAAREIIGQHFSKFYVPEDIEANVPFAALEFARNSGHYDSEGWRCRKDGGRFWASAVIDALYEEGKLIGFAKITRDLTERREIQLELERSREQLFQAQKMEAVGQLTGGLAHDFNNLLMGISGSLELLKARLERKRFDDLERYIGIAQKSAEKAASLTHRLLAFARRQTLDPRPIDANQMVSNMTDLLQHTAGPEIRVEASPAQDLWLTLCDANQLESAILNLCINARDAMPGGGQVLIETINAELDARMAGIYGLSPGQYVTVSVSDTGTGMPPDVIERAFDPFFTTKPIGQGTGLGLSMIYGFAQQSGGQIRIYSEVGVGTIIRLYLPRYIGDSEVDEGEDTTGRPERHVGAERVLVVDDEPAIRLLVSEVLRDFGYFALEAADAASGLTALKTEDHIDLLITDVGLPGGMNGRQLAEAARRIKPELKVLFITGYAEKAIIGSGRLEAGMHVLTKPFGIDLLTAKIRTVLGGN